MPTSVARRVGTRMLRPVCSENHGSEPRQADAYQPGVVAVAETQSVELEESERSSQDHDA